MGQQMLMAGAASCRDVQGFFDSPATQNRELSFVRAFSPILFVIILYNNRHSWDHSPPYVLHLISPCTQLHNTTTAASLEIVRQQLSAFCLFSKDIEYLFISSIYFLKPKATWDRGLLEEVRLDNPAFAIKSELTVSSRSR
jgi:hypothetical protein